jgi:transcriptional regulator with XRE-family HTH domain
MNQVDLAKASGVAQNTISEIELGKREARAGTLKKLADALSVEISDLLGEPVLAGKVEPPSRGLGRSDPRRKWASDEEYEAALAMVRKMYQKRYEQIHGLRPPSSHEERRKILTDVAAAYRVLKAVGVSEENRAEGFWMRETMVVAATRIIDALRNTREVREEAGEADIPVIELEAARERLRAA